MSSPSYDRYVESTILNAGPVELVHLMLRASVGSVQQARLHLGTGDVAARGRSIDKTMAIVNELIISLDREAAPEYSRNAMALYLYIGDRLTEGHLHQADGPLAEAEGLLETLATAWEQMDAAASSSGAFELAEMPTHLMAERPEAAFHAWTA